MKKLMKLLIVALVAGAVATMVVQRDRLRQLDKAELMAQLRDAVQSKLPSKGDGDETSNIEAAAEEAGEEVDVTTESAVDDSDDKAAES